MDSAERSEIKSLADAIPKLLEREFDIRNSRIEILASIPVLHQNWELDAWAILVQINGNRKFLIHSDHGRAICVENPRQFIEEQNAKYQHAIKKGQEAQALLLND